MEVLVIEPHAYCEGVLRALASAKKALNEHPGEPVYLLGSLVHNEDAIASLERDGLVLLDERGKPLEQYLGELKEGSVVVYSAHGHGDALRRLADKRHLVTYDATCRFVKENMDSIRLDLLKGEEVIYIGEEGHLECLAALSLGKGIHLYDSAHGIYPFSSLTRSDPLIYSQTTMSVEDIEKASADIKNHCPDAVFAQARCHSTIARQEALLAAPKDCDLFVILGSETSNNTMKLYSLAKKNFPQAQVLRVLNASELKKVDIIGKKKAALASGASTSLEVFDAAKRYLLSL
jgi:4-hydroxy-3-methylbut-2-enyl diphosphate reductase